MTYQNFIKIVFALTLMLFSFGGFAAGNTAAKLVPVITFILDGDRCIRTIGVGTSFVEGLNTSCESEGRLPLRAYASYYSFYHSGGPLHIDLLSGYPNSYDPFLYLRVGEARDGPVLASDDDGAGDRRGSRYSSSNLAAGVYTIEATSFVGATAPNPPSVMGEFNLSLYGAKVTASPTGKLNDTGSKNAGISLTETSLNCDPPSSAYIDQDCNHGRDKDGFLGYSNAQNSTDGVGGFSFLKVGANGQPLPENASSWNCVKDNVTGLMWEVKTDNNPTDIHDKDFRFTWFNPNANTNGGGNGSSGGVSTTCQIGTGVFCNTFAYQFIVNHHGLCGYNDWRLPTVSELFSLISLSDSEGGDATKIDGQFFPNTVSGTGLNDYYWSSIPTPYVEPIHAVNVSFRVAGTYVSSKSSAYHVRLVRGE